MTATPETISKKRTRLPLGKALGIGLIVFFGYIIFSWVDTKRSIEKLCFETPSGSVVADVRAKALATGLHFYSPDTANENGRFLAFITSSAVFGRYVCEVEHDGKVITRTRLQFND